MTTMQSQARWRVATPPANLPLDLDDLKEHLRIEADHENALLVRYLREATDFVQDMTRTALIDTVFTEYFDCFNAPMLLTWAVTNTVDSITYVDGDGATQTLAADQYVLDPAWDRGIVRPAYGVTWPTPRGDTNSVVVTYSCGFGSDETAVPQRWKGPVRKWAGALYETREGEQMEGGGALHRVRITQAMENDLRALSERIITY